MATKVRMPNHLRELDSEYGMEQFRTAAAWFAKRGISVGYVPRKGWRFFCIGRMDGPTCVICWVGLGGMIDMLDSPSATVAAMHDRGADTRLRD